MSICIYCRLDKSESDFSLEHIIPQSLGGAAAPDYFKTRKVCSTCNNNLGLFVDASFEKLCRVRIPYHFQSFSLNRIPKMVRNACPTL
ncbi:MAG: HNH endonuclease [Methylobacter sp.]